MGDAVIPSDWEEEYCCYSIMWPNSPSWLAILRGLIILPSRGRYWQENTGIIVEAQSVIKATFDHNLALEESIMSCGSEEVQSIMLALKRLIELSTDGCCENQGSLGQGNDEVPFLEITQEEIVADPALAGFADEEEFLADKCAVAADILSKLSLDLGEMAITNITNMSISGIAALFALTLATPIPLANLVAIAGLLLAVAAEIVIATALSIVNENQQTLYCELYAGTSSEDSKTRFMAKYQELVDAGVADPVSNFAIMSLMGYMMNPSVVNRLYYKDLTRIWTGGDCSECIEETCGQCLDRMSGVAEVMSQYDVGGDWGEVVSNVESGYHFLSYSVNEGSAKIEFQNLVGWTDTTWGNCFSIGQDANGDVVSTNSFATFAAAAASACLVPPSTTIGQWAIVSLTSFTVEIKTSVCEV